METDSLKPSLFISANSWNSQKFVLLDLVYNIKDLVDLHLGENQQEKFISYVTQNCCNTPEFLQIFRPLRGSEEQGDNVLLQ